MPETLAIINKLLTEVFNDILVIEELSLKQGEFSDVSITEMHTVEAIGMYETKSMGEAAKSLNITVGTLTVAINNLVKKGYVERFRSEYDRRVVKIGLTYKGRQLHLYHEKFHDEMVNGCITGLTSEEKMILMGVLDKLHTFFKNKYLKGCDRTL